MNKPFIPLKEAFDSTFHHKFDFKDFLNLKIEQENESYLKSKRLVYNPSKKLKKYLRFLNNFIFKYAKVNKNVVHSYLKEKNAYTAVIKHADSNYFFKTDLQDFFYNITNEDIRKVLEISLPDIPICDINTYKENILNLVTADNILPVGFATSPNISNACLYDFDNSLENYCDKNNLIYTRYSDDIIISSNDKDNLNDIEETIEKFLNSFYGNKFKLNPHKTKHTHKGNKVKILGIVILPNGKVSVDIKTKKEIEILLHFYINNKDKFNNYLEDKFNGNLSSISGKLNYINSIDSEYLNKLRKKYGNFVVDYFYSKPA